MLVVVCEYSLRQKRALTGGSDSLPSRPLAAAEPQRLSRRATLATVASFHWPAHRLHGTLARRAAPPCACHLLCGTGSNKPARGRHLVGELAANTLQPANPDGALCAGWFEAIHRAGGQQPEKAESISCYHSVCNHLAHEQ